MKNAMRSRRIPLSAGYAADQAGGGGPWPCVQTFAEDDWLPLMQTRLRASTYDSYRRVLALHAYPYIGHEPLGEVSPVVLNRLYSKLLVEGRRNGSSRGLHPRSVRYVHVILHGLLSHAVDVGLLPYNPAGRTRPPRVVNPLRSPGRSWTAKELRRFLEFIEGERDYPAYHLTAMTGMRRGEVVGLRWPEVDLENRRVLIRRTLVSVAYAVTDSLPKAASQRRFP